MFVRAELEGANLQRADLSGALGLTEEQLNAAIGDDQTVLPDDLIRRPSHFSKAEGRECPSAGVTDRGILQRLEEAAGVPGRPK